MIASAVILMIAATLAGKPVEVTCHSGPEFNSIMAGFNYSNVKSIQGLAQIRGEKIWLRNRTCKVLNRVADGRLRDWRNWKKVGLHTLVLGHEIAHTRGADELTAECEGYQQTKKIAKMLNHPRPFRIRDWAKWWAGCREEVE